ncbi:MAG: GNAT family N-acetyltransferase [Bdellovibrionales bacterium]|nr:GNAT family N-acetyltransferase [Bdellovibrionales bacterium]
MKNQERLRAGQIALRPIVRSDGPWLSRLYSSAANMAMIPGGTRGPEESDRQLEIFLAHWSQHGIGMWIIEADDTPQPVGYAGLRYTELEDTTLLEFGLIIDKPFWRKRIGTTVVRRILDYVDSALSVEIVALIHPSNIPSQRLLAQFGFAYSRQVERRESVSQLWIRRSRQRQAPHRSS